MARAGRTRQDIIVNNVALVSDFMPNPLLPKTRSQMAVPMVAGDKLIGVLDVQSDKLGQFSEADLRVMATLADQVSIIIQNAYTYQQVQAVERSLEDRASFLQSLIDAIPNPIFYKDMQGHYQGFNAAFLKYIGRTREDILGKTVYDLSPKALAEVYHARDQEIYHNPDSIQVYESQVRSADGTRPVIFNKAIIANADGSPWGLVGVITDITERLQAEEALRESEERFRLIMENSLDGVALASSQGLILMANPALCQMLGRSEDELCALKQSQIIDESDPRFARFVAELQETGRAARRIVGLLCG